MKARYEKEIERLYLKMFQGLFEYARSSLPSDSLAEEAVQDAFSIACQKPELLVNSRNPEGWMVNTLRNVISNTMRMQDIGKRILLRYVTLNMNELTVTEDHVRFELLYEDILDLEEFKLVKEYALDGKSYLEISQELGVSIPTCRKRVQRAREILQKKISL